MVTIDIVCVLVNELSLYYDFYCYKRPKYAVFFNVFQYFSYNTQYYTQLD